MEPRKPAFRLWIAALPGLLIVTGFAVNAIVQMGQASRAISGNGTSKAIKSLRCVETYAVTLTSSEYYVREGDVFKSQKTTPEVSTVVSGMVRNDCGDPLKSVTIHINVRDDDGKRGEGSVTIAGLNTGEAKPFSKAWMGRVTSYEIDKIQ